MRLTAEIEREGDWLFRWRSYLPLGLLGLFAIDLENFSRPFASVHLHDIWHYCCLAISFCGLLVRCLVAGFVPGGTSGRNTKGQYAECLNTNGIYSVVRHPLYIGNYLIGLGVASISLNWWMPTIYTLGFWLYYERIMAAEERFLAEKFGRDFLLWADQTPAFFPNLSQWSPAHLSFSFRTVLRREYTALMLLVLLHCCYEQLEYAVLEHRFIVEYNWLALLITAAVAYFTLRTLKRNTTLLLVEGR